MTTGFDRLDCRLDALVERFDRMIARMDAGFDQLLADQQRILDQLEALAERKRLPRPRSSPPPT